jgi:hypothetical protein
MEPCHGVALNECLNTLLIVSTSLLKWSHILFALETNQENQEILIYDYKYTS